MSSQRSQSQTDSPKLDEATPLISNWADKLDAAQLLQRTEAVELLVAAAREDRTPEQALLEHFRDQPASIERLAELQTQIGGFENASGPPRQNPSKVQARESESANPDVTQAGSRRGRRRHQDSRQGDSHNTPSNHAGTSNSDEKTPSTRATENDGDSSQDNFETLGGRGSRSSRSHRPGTSKSGRSSRNSNAELKSSNAAPRKNPSSTTAPTWSAGWQRYEVREEVGRGGCGVVERAYDRQLRREVVIKRIVDGYADIDEIVQRFVTEAQVTGQLEHPGIVPVHEIGEDQDGNPFFVMKEVRGATLADKINELRDCKTKPERARSQRQLLDRFLAVCRTLAFAHDAGVIHRDIKPANIMVGEFGETLLLDWGLARKVRESDPQKSNQESEAVTLIGGSKAAHRRESATSYAVETPTKSSEQVHVDRPSGVNLENSAAMTQQGTVLGTAAYMSPEQAKGLNAEVDERSDVFSLGVVLYEILTGTSPFRSNTVQDTIERVARCDFAPVRQCSRAVPRALAAICSKALHQRQDDRYSCAAKLAEDVESYLAGGRVQAYQEPVWERLDRAANNHRGLYRAVFGSCILLAIGATFAATQIGRAHMEERRAKLVAIAASEDAAQARDWEMEARKHTEEQFAASREAADQWLLKLSGDLQYYPGMQTIRDALIREGVEHYEELCSTSESRRLKILADRSRLDDNLAHEAYLESIYCSLRLGDLYRLAARAHESKQQYGHAISLAEERRSHLLANPPSEHDPQISSTGTLTELDELATQRANAVLGETLLVLESASAEANSTRAELESAHGNLSESIQILEGVVKHSPESLDPRNALARSLLVSSRFEEALLVHSGDEKDEVEKTTASNRAMECLDAALRHSEILQQASSDDRFSVLTSTILEERARRASKCGDRQQAVILSNEWYFYAEQRASKNPQRPDLLESRSLAGLSLGANLSADAKHADALHALEDADRDLNESWNLLFGQNFYRENAAILASTRADAQIAVGDFDGANLSTQDSIENLRVLLQTEGVSDQRIRLMLANYLRSLDLYWLQNNSTETAGAEEQIKQCGILLEHLKSSTESSDSAERAELETQLQLWHQHLRLHALRIQQRSLTHPESKDTEWSRTAEFDAMNAEHNRLEGEAKSQSAIWLAEANLERFKLTENAQAETVDLTELLVSCELDLQTAIENGRPSVREKALALTLESAWRRNGHTIPSRAASLVGDWVIEMPRSAQAWHWQAIVQVMNGQLTDAEKSLHETIRFRDGKPTVCDELLELLIRSRKANANTPDGNAPDGNTPEGQAEWMSEASTLFEEAAFKSSHADLLLDAFTAFDAPPPGVTP